MEVTAPKPMTLRQLINELQKYVNDDLPEDTLLDLPVKIQIPDATGCFNTRTMPLNVVVESQTIYSAKAHKNETKKWVEIKTSRQICK